MRFITLHENRPGQEKVFIPSARGESIDADPEPFSLRTPRVRLLVTLRLRSVSTASRFRRCKRSVTAKIATDAGSATGVTT